MRFVFIFYLLIYFHSEYSIAKQPVIKNYETELQQLFARAAGIKTDSERIKIFNEIDQLFAEILEKPEAFSYPFDSLRNIGKIVSKDGKVRIFTWNFLLSNAVKDFSNSFNLFSRSFSEIFSSSAMSSAVLANQ